MTRTLPADPIQEAAELAVESLLSPETASPTLIAYKGADAALSRVRDLHRPIDELGVKMCVHCYETAWPCDTAMLAYTEEELA